MYAGQARGEGPAETIIDAPRHPYTQLADLVAPRGRRPVRRDRLDRHPGQAPVAARAAAGLPLPRPLPARDRTKCAEEPPFVDGRSRDHWAACWRRER